MAKRETPSGRRDAAVNFIERHGLWTAAQERAAHQVERAIKQHDLELVRFSFADQHGVLRGKTLLASEVADAMRNGVSMTTTLLAKDTSHKTVYPVFTPGGGFAMEEMQGGGDFVMIADPTTFRVLPWAEKTGWLLCDIHFTNGKPVPFSTRARCRDALDTLAKAGFDFCAGLEVEFHLFKLENPRLAPSDATWPPQAPEVSLLTQGYQYLTESRFDMLDPAVAILRRGIAALDLPLRSVEIELGPSQCEFTFRPLMGLAAADAMVLFRSAVKQIARRNGYLASFMCRPGLPNVMSSGWHLHQSLIDRKPKRNAFADRAWPLATRPALSRGSVGACTRWGRLHHPDHKRLQALPGLFAGARPRHLGVRQSRRDDTRARSTGRDFDPSGKPRRRAVRQSLSLYRLADLRGARRHRAKARSGALRRHALRDEGCVPAQGPARGSCGFARDKFFAPVSATPSSIIMLTSRRRKSPAFTRRRASRLKRSMSRLGNNGNIWICSEPPPSP